MSRVAAPFAPAPFADQLEHAYYPRTDRIAAAASAVVGEVAGRMTDVVVPKWGLTMEEAEVLRWLKAVGDTVTEGEPILELETDKATGEVEAPASGVLAETLVEPGAHVEPGQLVARIDP